MKRIIYISNPMYGSGGAFRSLVTLERLKNYNIDAYPIIPENLIVSEEINIEKSRIIGRIRQSSSRGPARAPLIHLFIQMFKDFCYAYIMSKKIRQKYGKRFFELVYTHHEDLRYVYLAYLISKFLKIPKAALLCLPAFSKDDRITKVRLQSYNIIHPKNTHKLIRRKIYFIIDVKVTGAIIKTILSIMLRQFDLIIAVSTAIIEEMNGKWQTRIHVLDPNTSYEHLHIDIQSTKRGDENYRYDAVFYTGLIPEKGIFDIPLIWEKVTAKGFKAKLAVAGKFEAEQVKKAFFKLIDRLSLNEHVEYLGLLPHEKLNDLLQSSKMVIYPSYLDSISMVVIESLAHNKIIAAYDIPAMRHNFPIKEVIKVRIGDYKAMAQKIKEILVNEQYRNVDRLKFVQRFERWDEVVKSEVKILKKVLS